MDKSDSQPKDTPSSPFTPGTQKTNWDRDEVHKVLQSLEKIEDNQKIIKEETESSNTDCEKCESLKEEKEELKRELDKFQKSVPLPVYGALVSGIFLAIFGYWIIPDLFYFVSGIVITVISITGILESKVRGGRVS